MIHKMIYDIQIGSTGKSFKLTDKGVIINKSINSITNTCILYIPKRTKDNIGELENSYFSDIKSSIKRGTQIVVYAGYQIGLQANLAKVFEGFVNIQNISQSEVEIICDDYMYFFKRAKINLVQKDIKLSAVIKKLVDSANLEIDIWNKYNKENDNELLTLESNYSSGSQLTKIVIDESNDDFILDVSFEKTTAVNCLQVLYDNYGLKVNIFPKFFAPSGKETFDINLISVLKQVFHISNVRSGLTKNKVKFNFTDIPSVLIDKFKNTDSNFANYRYNKIINRDNLKFQSEDDVRYKVNIRVFLDNSKFQDFPFGDEDGEIRTFFMNGKNTQAEINKKGEDFLKQCKYTGFKQQSSFTTFGLCAGFFGTDYSQDVFSIPNIYDEVIFDGIGLYRGNTIFEDKSTRFLFDRPTSYMIESVKTTFNNSGFRNEIGLGVNIGDVNGITDKMFPDFTDYLEQNEKLKQIKDFYNENNIRNDDYMKILREKYKLNFK